MHGHTNIKPTQEFTKIPDLCKFHIFKTFSKDPATEFYPEFHESSAHNHILHLKDLL